MSKIYGVKQGCMNWCWLCATSLFFTVVVIHAPVIHATSRVDCEKSCTVFFFYVCMWFCSYSYGRDTRCDKSLRHAAMTGCCNKSPRVTCENHWRYDRTLSLRSVARIQTGLNLCDILQGQYKHKQPCHSMCTHLRQNFNQPMREHQLVLAILNSNKFTFPLF